MKEEQSKKKKLTLSIDTKKPVGFKSFSRRQKKTSFVIEKRKSRGVNFKNFSGTKQDLGSINRPKGGEKHHKKTSSETDRSALKNFEIRKIAEQRATNRFKSHGKIDEKSAKNKNISKPKSSISKREYKLTLSRALVDEELSYKERSLASVRRARLKEKKVVDKQKQELETKKVIREVNIPEKITIKELSNRMAEQASNIIKHMLGMGVTATINHTIDSDIAEYLVKEFGHKPIKEANLDLEFKKQDKIEKENLSSRPPIVTVMGHVDHGKTSLLDALRSTNIVSSEHGGITQHIGAYQVVSGKEKSITFIDTPGHEAFTEMRARGSKVTDIVVLVVAADDGVKPQTIESIKHAKAAKVPIIVAINKCDLPGADVQKVKNQLLEYELIAEELSGDTLFVEVSATTKKNLDKLKENINLQADLLELEINFGKKASGVILESRIDKGRGPVSTVLVTEGTLHKGDFFVCGATWGKIRAMINHEGKNIEEATPSTPVEILGMNSSAIAGDNFAVVESEVRAKEINNYRLESLKSKKGPLISVTQDTAFNDQKTVKEIPLIIKSDVHGSNEALQNAVEKIKHEEVLPKIVLSGIGLITETDVSLARASNAILIGFNVRPNKEAKKLAENYKIDIKFFNIIYEVLDFVKELLSGSLEPDVKEEVIGSAEVLEIFKVSKIGKVAGSKVLEGEIKNNSTARLIRDGKVLYNGSINSIFRESNAAKQVTEGLECGITLKDFADFKEKDVIEAYVITETTRSI